jgi:hypothetical protein
LTTEREAHEAWITAEKIKRVADRLIGLGPFSIGLDGMLAVVPVVGTAFSLGAGVWLVAEGFRVQASAFTLARMIFYVGMRTLFSIVPIEGWAADVLFRGHMHAANALQKDIAVRFGEPAPELVRAARRNPFAPRDPGAQPNPIRVWVLDGAQVARRWGAARVQPLLATRSADPARRP